jgi:Ni,Fe-hydrogenase III large subunit/Ni,Fe-hydrogenase III component G
MTAIDTLARALAEAGVPVQDLLPRRGNEIHCEVSGADIVRFAEVAIRDVGTDLILMAADDRRAASGAFFVHYLFAHRAQNWFLHASSRVAAGRPEIVSLGSFYYPASRFEREIRDLFGIEPAGHPDRSPLVKHGFWPADYHPLRKDARPAPFSDDGQPFPFTQVGGEGVYEIPVGPVHAGVIEPGHFRFSVLGETVINLRTRLYFTHKGTEKLFEGRPPAGGVELAERVSGDSTIGHALAFCQAVEAAAGVEVPPRARLWRAILLELERLYNHIADVGAIANDTGFAVAHAHCYRIREGLLRLNQEITGSRLLRGAVAPGGLARDLTAAADLPSRIHAVVADFSEVVSLCLHNTLLMDRLEATGVLSTERARDHGALGYVARASNLDADVRRDHPFAAYPDLRFRVPVYATGDVKARTQVRIDEVHESAAIVDQAVGLLAPGPVLAFVPQPEPFTPAFGIVEGWRGRIVHWVMTADDGTLHRVKIVDPSFFNWPALSYALEGNIVPDFPLCNKSFNQSYSGNDL